MKMKTRDQKSVTGLGSPTGARGLLPGRSQRFSNTSRCVLCMPVLPKTTSPHCASWKNVGSLVLARTRDLPTLAVRRSKNSLKKDHSRRAIRQLYDATENRLAGRLYPQPRGQSSTAFATGCQSDGDHLLAVSDRHPGPRLHKVGKALGEDVARRVTHCDSKICAR